MHHISFITNKKIIVTLHANSIAGALSKESWKVQKLWQERKWSVSTAVSTASRTMTKTVKSSSRRNISSDGASWESGNCQQTVQYAFSFICSAVNPKKHGIHW